MALTSYRSALLVALCCIAVQAQGQGINLVADGVHEVGYQRNTQQAITNDPGIIWATKPSCTSLPDANPGIPGEELLPALFTRGSTFGVTPRRILDINPTRPLATCNPYQLQSNLVMDDDYVYYVDNGGANGNSAI